MTTHQQYNRINKATLTATELVADLRDAHTHAGEIEEMVILPIIEQAAKIQQTLARLRAAHCNEGIEP